MMQKAKVFYSFLLSVDIVSSLVCTSRVDFPENYHEAEIPPSEPLNVDVVIGIFYLDRVDDDKLSYTAYTGLTFYWQDLRLAKHDNSTCGLRVVGRKDLASIWKPGTADH